MIIKKKYIFVAAFFVLSLLIFSFLANAENETGTKVETQTATETTIEESTTAPLTDTTDSSSTNEKQGTSAENNQNSDAQLSIGAGITPDSPFYFVEDKILTQFRDDSRNREKKIAEIEAMINEGNIEAARKALEKYKIYASELENEVDPEKSEEAKRSAEAIRNKVKEIESKIPEEAKKDFIKDINERESKISTAAELSQKIKELCESLSKVDPVEYGRVCRTSNDAPRWQKRLDQKLTGEQKVEAEAFFKIMSQCFRNPKECECDKISVKAFADKCSVVAPLAVKCEQEGDEKACKEMDEKTEGIEELLPEHLQDVMAGVEEEFGDAKFENYMPPECREAGVKTPRECEKIMIRTHAPEECIQAFDKGDISFNNPRQFEKACQEIMFKLNAPEECVTAGLKDPKECGKLMFKTNAPQECVDAGLTGESRSDEKKCREIMESQREGERGGPGKGFGFALGKNCNSIQNKDEKLKCFEEMFNNAQEHYGFEGGPRGGEFKGGYDINRAPPECRSAGAKTSGECEKIMIEQSKRRFEDTRKYEEEFANSCRDKGGRWDCGFGGVTPGNPCRCFFDDQFRQQPPTGQFPQQRPPTEFQCPPDMNKKCEGNGCFCVPPEQPSQQPPTQTTQPTTTEQQTSQTQTGTSGTTTGESGGTSSTGTTTERTDSSSSGGTSGSSTTTESTGTSSSSSSSTSGTTGSVIGIDNEFLDYYFK